MRRECGERFINSNSMCSLLRTQICVCLSFSQVIMASQVIPVRFALLLSAQYELVIRSSLLDCCCCCCRRLFWHNNHYDNFCSYSVIYVQLCDLCLCVCVCVCASIMYFYRAQQLAVIIIWLNINTILVSFRFLCRFQSQTVSLAILQCLV